MISHWLSCFIVTSGSGRHTDVLGCVRAIYSRFFGQAVVLFLSRLLISIPNCFALLAAFAAGCLLKKARGLD